jgi:hypothetical protein
LHTVDHASEIDVDDPVPSFNGMVAKLATGGDARVGRGARGGTQGQGRSAGTHDAASHRLDCPRVFHVRGKPIGDFREAWGKARDAAGLAGLLVHDFRRCAVRNLTRAGVTETVAMKLTGHKTRAIFDRYNIVSESDLSAATERLSRHLAQQPTAPRVASLAANTDRTRTNSTQTARRLASRRDSAVRSGRKSGGARSRTADLEIMSLIQPSVSCISLSTPVCG